MSKISLNLVGVIIIGLIVWWFWRSRRHDLAQWLKRRHGYSVALGQ